MIPAPSQLRDSTQENLYSDNPCSVATVCLMSSVFLYMIYFYLLTYLLTY